MLTTDQKMELVTTKTSQRKFTALLKTACLITACTERRSSLQNAQKLMVKLLARAGAMSTIITTCMAILSATEEKISIMELATTTTISLTRKNSIQQQKLSLIKTMLMKMTMAMKMKMTKISTDQAYLTHLSTSVPFQYIPKELVVFSLFSFVH